MTAIASLNDPHLSLLESEGDAPLSGVDVLRFRVRESQPLCAYHQEELLPPIGLRWPALILNIGNGALLSTLTFCRQSTQHEWTGAARHTWHSTTMSAQRPDCVCR